MTIKSTLDQASKWQSKAVEYIREANQFEVEVMPPSVNHSTDSFTIDENRIYFGFSGVKGVGPKASKQIVSLRGTTPFKDLRDFLIRTDGRVNRGTARALAQAGAFDTFGFDRLSLVGKMDEYYEYYRAQEAYDIAVIEAKERDELRAFMAPVVERRKKLRQQFSRKKYKEMPEFQKEALPEWQELQRLESGEIEYNGEMVPLKMQPARKLKAPPVAPNILRYDKSKHNPGHYISQAKAIGCYLTDKDVLNMCYPGVGQMEDVLDYPSNRLRFAAYISKSEIKKTRKKKRLYIVNLLHGNKEIDAIMYPKEQIDKKDMPEIGDVVLVEVTRSQQGDRTRYRINSMSVYGRGAIV